MKKLSDFRNIHKNETILVLGLGWSLNELSKHYLNDYITIGINDIQRMSITPNYLLYCDVFKNKEPREQFKYWVTRSNAEYIFTRKIN